MHLRNLFSCLLYGSVAFGPAVSAAIIENGSFESPALADGAAARVTPTAWQWLGSAGSVINPASGSIPAFDGAQFVDLGNTSAFALRQDFSIAVGGSYGVEQKGQFTCQAERTRWKRRVNCPSNSA